MFIIHKKTEKIMQSEEFKEMRVKALAQLRSGESLTGKNGAFDP